jgi:hypothetical protein
MTALVSKTNSVGFDRVVLEEDPGLGIYCFAFERADSKFPEWDYLEDTWEIAKSESNRRWGVPLESWTSTNEYPKSAGSGMQQPILGS